MDLESGENSYPVPLVDVDTHKVKKLRKQGRGKYCRNRKCTQMGSELYIPGDNTKIMI